MAEKNKITKISEILGLFPDNIAEISARYRYKAYTIHKITTVILKVVGVISPLIASVSAIIELLK